jgi:hypothetical protein
MAMTIVDNLFIEVANSDAFQNRRTKNTRARSASLTGSYYTNDDPEKYDEINHWFNEFSNRNVFYIDTEKTQQYLYLMKKLVVPHSNAFIDDLEDYILDIHDFDMIVHSNHIEIPAMKLTGDSNRYLKFDNSNGIVKRFRKLICGDITKIVIKKKNNQFFVWLELHENYKDILTSNGAIIEQPNQSSELVDVEPIQGGYNKLYYGTPGCGKSYLVQKTYEIEENITFRTTFYPDYSNSDFIGQILPKINDDNQISYEFTPGVFSKSLLSALYNPSKKVVLIIEELNRGNAASIFGDVFQLLDRDSIGKSLYTINIPMLSEWLKKNEIYQKTIFLPSNLFIVATMNTSDQNVYSLDTAFKRRWIMESVNNDFSSDLDWFEYFIPGSKYTWKHFVETVNQFILKNNVMNLNNEDKRLGVFFVSKNELSQTPMNTDREILKIFAYKVLMYLWDDVSKLNRDEWFDNDIFSLDQLFDKFIEYSATESLNILSFYKTP